MSDKKRLLLAIALSMGILIFWQTFILTPPVEEGEGQKSAETEAADKDKDKKTEGTTPDGATPSEVTPETPVVAVIEPATALLETDHFKLALTNMGGRAIAHNIKAPERYSHRGDLLGGLKTDRGVHSKSLPFGTLFGMKNGPDVNSAYELVEGVEAAEGAKGGETVHFRWTSPDKTLQVDKVYSKAKSEFGIKLDVTVTNKSAQDINDSIRLDLFGRQSSGEEPSFFEPKTPMQAVCFADNDTERADKDDDSETFKESVRWVTVDDSYFVTAAAASDARRCTIGGADDFVASMISRDIAVAAGQAKTLTYDLYIGPKEGVFLESFGDDLDRTIDYGWVEFIAKPLHWLLVLLHSFVNSWGLAIIMLTLAIRGILWPVTQRSQDSMMRMKDLQPKIKEMQEKYKDNPTMIQQKQLELFKEHNVSPFGCLPMLLQIPIWFALYRTIYSSAELYQASFLWVSDLSSPDPLYILPVIVGILFFIQQRISSSSASTEMRQKIVMHLVTGMFVIFMFVWPAGLNVYILMSTIVGILQAFYAKRRNANMNLGGGGSDGKPEAAETTESGSMSRAAARREARAARKGR